MQEVIYLKKMDDYDEIIGNKIKLPMSFKRFIFLFKNLFNIVTIKEEDLKICILPIKEKVSKKKLEKIIQKVAICKKVANSQLVISNDLIKENITEILDRYHLCYFKGEKIRKILIFKILEYINRLQNQKSNSREITILCNNNNEVNEFIIKKLAKEYKTIKIVSEKIYQFKKLEENLYDEFGIAIQFSNSYQKSLLKSEIIVNLDFSEIEINEYKVNPCAIIVNVKNNTKIKSKLFNGIIINSCKIRFSEEMRELFYKPKLLHRYEMLVLYESLVDWKKQNYESIIEDIENNEVYILNLIGNNGIINRKEFKNVK